MNDAERRRRIREFSATNATVGLDVFACGLEMVRLLADEIWDHHERLQALEEKLATLDIVARRS